MILYIFIAIILLSYFYFTRNHSYWSKRNIKHDTPIPVFGNHLKNILCYKSITTVAADLYRKYRSERVVGYYRGNTPELVICDPDLVRQILNNDFASFYPRGLGRNPKVEPLHNNLFHTDGDKWKLLRQRLTAAFTTSKLKNMFPLVVECAEKLQTLVEDLAKHENEVDVRELMARFTTEFISACVFGIKTDAISNEKSQFRELGKLLFHRDPKNLIYVAIMDLFPQMKNHISFFNGEILQTMINLFENVSKQRNYKPIGRNDFIDLILELEIKGKVEGDSVENKDSSGLPVRVEMEMTVEVMVSQLFVFFVAGFETSSSATSFTLFQLAKNPDIQKRVQDEIDKVLLKYNNKLCYEALEEMDLLDMAFKESMRMFPSVGCLHRVCAKTYTLPGLEVTIDPGVRIIIPIQAIQMDEKYFDNPSEFRPERFTSEKEQERHKYVYLPFGAGPRACIGTRLGHMQSLAGLAALLSKYRFEPGPSTKPNLEINESSNVIQGVVGGIPLKIVLRTDRIL